MQPLLSVKQTAAALGVSPATVYRLAKSDTRFPPPVRVAGRVLYDPTDLEAYRAALKSPAN